MINIKNPVTSQIPSAFGMPVSGATLGRTTACTTGATPSVVRDRGAIDVAVTGAVLGLAQGYFPGNSAWRPPNC